MLDAGSSQATPLDLAPPPSGPTRRGATQRPLLRPSRDLLRSSRPRHVNTPRGHRRVSAEHRGHAPLSGTLPHLRRCPARQQPWVSHRPLPLPFLPPRATSSWSPPRFSSVAQQLNTFSFDSNSSAQGLPRQHPMWPRARLVSLFGSPPPR
jgi:hypothetical protein